MATKGIAMSRERSKGERNILYKSTRVVATSLQEFTNFGTWRNDGTRMSIRIRDVMNNNSRVDHWAGSLGFQLHFSC